MRVGTAEQSALIREALSGGKAELLDEVLKIVEATQAIPYTRALAVTYSGSAAAALDDLPDSSYKKALLDLTQFALSRAS